MNELHFEVDVEFHHGDVAAAFDGDSFAAAVRAARELLTSPWRDGGIVRIWRTDVFPEQKMFERKAQVQA